MQLRGRFGCYATLRSPNDSSLSLIRPAVRRISGICAFLLVVPRICVSDGFFRCGNWLVSAESSVEELLQKCGKPSSQQVSTEDVYAETGYKMGTRTIEILRYDRGTAAPPMIVTIVDGRIESIQRGK